MKERRICRAGSQPRVIPADFGTDAHYDESMYINVKGVVFSVIYAATKAGVHVLVRT
jgi:hypothetical protein